jgi:hypothetical protein
MKISCGYLVIFFGAPGVYIPPERVIAMGLGILYNAASFSLAFAAVQVSASI